MYQAKAKYCYDYPRPCVTTDMVIFRENEGTMELLLIERKNEPYKGCWAFPGGFLNDNETLEQCASRELEEETSLKDLVLTQFKAYSSLKRDPRHRTITIVFVGFLTSDQSEIAGDDAAKAKWFSISAFPSLAFDHQQIIDDVLEDLSEGTNVGA